MEKMNMNKRGKRFCAGLLAAALGFSMVIPADVRAKEAAGNDPAESEIEAKEVPRGDYVVCAVDGAGEKEACLDEAQEIIRDAGESIYETDLSAEEAARLEEADEIIVEENFFLSGAKIKDGKEKKNKWEIQNRQEEKKETEWNYKMVRADEEDMKADGQGTVKVAVLDSGVELLSGIPVKGNVNLVKEEQYLPYYMDDMVGHGTAAADIIYHICPDAEIYSVRVLDSGNRGRLSDVVEGIYWCIEQGMDVINMSFGTTVESEILKKAIEAASDAGILITGAAGNGGSGAAVEYPAAYPEVIAVGAVDTSAQKTEESAAGPEVELVAPGEQILTKSVFGMETVNSGTSMAAPHVAGAAALLIQQDEEKGAEEIRGILDASGNPIGEEEAYGYGLLDVAYAQDLLENGGAALEEFSARTDTEEEMPVREEAAVQTFEEVDYVEGRWKKDGHEQLTESGARAYGGFTETQIRLLKAGAVYPDKALPTREAFPEWHGYFKKTDDTRVNYIANYIFATKIAKNGGRAPDLAIVKGQDRGCYAEMQKVISTSGIQTVPVNEKKEKGVGTWESWGIIIKRETGGDTGLVYSEQTADLKEKWRRYFLYGMAIHTATDAFAHNCFEIVGDDPVFIRHPSADEPDTANNRFLCAGNTAYEIAANSQLKILGVVTDFSSRGKSYWNGFYMRALMSNAIEADSENLGTTYLTNQFKAVDYTYYNQNKKT